MKQYSPCLNDYVRWKQHEGWVYFVCDEYITIEISTRDKHCDLGHPHHRKDHLLVVCYNHCWDQIEYIRNRKSIYDR